MNKEQNIIILKDLLEYLEYHNPNLPAHIFETLGEVINDLKNSKL